jgi:Spore germination protein
MSRGISIAALFLVLQYGMFMFIYPQSIIQSQQSGHWLAIVLGWLVQGVLLRLLVGGLSADKSDLLARFVHAGGWLRLCLVWPLMLVNLVTIAVVIRGHSQILSILYLPNTPLWVLFALLLATSVGIAYAGRDSLLRLSLLIWCFGFPLIVLSNIAVANFVHPRLALPIEPSLAFMDKPTILPVFFVFSNVFGLIGFFGPLTTNAKRWLWGAWAFSIFFFLLNVYIPLSVFGEEVAVHLRFPLITALDGVRVNWFFFDRISLFYVMAIMFSTLLNVSGLLWLNRAMTVKSPFLPRRAADPLVMAVLAIVIACFIPNLEALERMLRWGGPLRFGLLLILALTGAYVRSQSKLGGQPRA